jgi:hypothetical protein
MSSSEDEYDPAGALDDIESTLDTLETILEPLLSGKMTWEEMLEKESGDHMGRAKLNMMMAFGVCDLLFGESLGLGVEEGVNHRWFWSRSPWCLYLSISAQKRSQPKHLSNQLILPRLRLHRNGSWNTMPKSRRQRPHQNVSQPRSSSILQPQPELV